MPSERFVDRLVCVTWECCVDSLRRAAQDGGDCSPSDVEKQEEQMLMTTDGYLSLPASTKMALDVLS